MGAKGYVKKPFQASELHGLIEKITAAWIARASRSQCRTSRSPPSCSRIYLEDARGHLEALDHGLLALEREGLDREVVAAVLGPLHTLKGNSGMMGFTGIKDYVHRLEDVFARVRDGGLALDAGALRPPLRRRLRAARRGGAGRAAGSESARPARRAAGPGRSC